MGGEDLVDGGHRHGLRAPGGSGSIEARGLVESAVRLVRNDGCGIPGGGVFLIGDGLLHTRVADADQAGRAMRSKLQGLQDAVAVLDIEQQDRRLGVIQAPGQLAGGEAEVDRAADGAVLLGCDIGEGELGAVR